jgi:hypothetical protein
MVLPTRSAEISQLRRRAQAIARGLAAKLRGTAVTVQPATEIANRLTEADGLARAARFDEAARAFDAALSEAAHEPHRIVDGPLLVSALVRRASIAVARNETHTAEHLLARALRYDPAFQLTALEERPRLLGVVADQRKHLGERPPLGREDLGAACDSDVLVVLRVLSRDSTEVLRLDRCALVSQQILGADDDAVVAALAAGPSSAPSAAVTPARPQSKVLRWLPWVSLSLGLAALATGAGLAGSVDPEYQRLLGSCGRTMSCLPVQYADLRTRETAGWAMLAVGGTLTIVGITLGIVARRGRPKHADRLSISF